VRRVLAGSVVASLAIVAWALTHGVHGTSEGLVMLAPALAFALPLLTGRYVGERTIARVRAARGLARPRRRLAAAPPRRRPRLALVPRGGLLLASSLATRPPPALS